MMRKATSTGVHEMWSRTATRALVASLAATLMATSPCGAHVGSPDVWYEGMAGAYPLAVVVRLPGVVPGIAEVTVRVTGGPAPTGVSLVVNRFDAVATAPPPEAAARVAGDSMSFTGRLWVMEQGSNSVTVRVSGSRGVGVVVVPVSALATRRLPLSPVLGTVLVLIAVFLFVGAISIAGAATREGSLAPGLVPDGRRRRRARIVMGVTGILVSAILFGGWTWWSAVDTAYRAEMFRPLATRATDDEGTLRLVITDSAWRHRGDSAWLTAHDASQWSPLIPDHGKLVHLFLVRSSGVPVFAHLHPMTADSNQFMDPLPMLPPGRYRLFADIVHESGFEQTLTTAVDLTGGAGPAAAAAPDSDDAFTLAPPVAADRAVRFADGTTIAWLDPHPETVGAPAGLRFVVRDRDGAPAVIEPYMGMAAHAVVVRDDGAVFVHLHPMGTVSAASQQALALREPADSMRGRLARRLTTLPAPAMAMPMAMPMPSSGGSGGAALASIVSFPYAFPSAGTYDVWVQVRRHGAVLTAPFVVRVTAARGAPA
jgi:hypothetical protein